MVDWRVARRIAAGVAGTGPTGPHVEQAELAELCADAQRRVVAYARLEPRAPLPEPEWVDRAGWAEANLRGMRGVLDPVAERIRPRFAPAHPLGHSLRALSGLLLGAEVGGLVGLLAQRVLGQYEMPPTDPEAPARLLFVAPNLEESAQRLEADRGQLLRWVAVHEVTHGVQFTSVPWLRGHVAGLVEELTRALDVRLDLRRALRFVGSGGLRAAAGRLRADGLVAAALGPERRELLDRIQATMALIEGHAEHVMDAAAVDVLPDLERLRAQLDRRRRERSTANPLLRLLERLLGVEMKLRQYEAGKRFCDAVVQRGGIDALNRAWSGPEALPTWAELGAPERWLARV